MYTKDEIYMPIDETLEDENSNGCSEECTPEAQDKPISVNSLTARDIRSLVFHLLYAMDSHEYETPLQSIIDSINQGFDLDIPLNHKAVTIVREIIQHREELDASYTPLLKNWRIERVGVATKLILRYAMWELLHTDIDTRIIINEAVELAKCFAEEDAHRFINGILDRAAKAVRAECSSTENKEAQ